jgi:hypothetical protein
MATLLNELTRDKVHTNNPIPVGTKHGTHENPQTELWLSMALTADQKYLESFEMWCWRRMEKISWTDHVRNEEVLLKSQ